MTMSSASTRPIAAWLFFCAAAVFLMALIGAVTRLTESGLSIVEWKPVTGALPPLSANAWQDEFARYQQSPQYVKINHGMTLGEFKQIFFWEWLHRLWGRLIGIFYALPFALFLARGRLPAASKPALWGIFALGLMQGFMGWYMVKSGLVDRPSVSHYRLAAHLMLAFAIYACLLRMALAFSLPPDKNAAQVAHLRRKVKGILVAAILTMTWGAFVAGLDAGMLYNTFPDMNGYFVPPELMAHKPIWLAFFEEPATVQFTHRMLAMLVVIKTAFFLRRAFALHLPPRIRMLARLLAGAVLLQALLGIATLLTQVNIVLATAHQAGALLLLSVLVWLLHEIPHIKKLKD
jgi:heme a synthase